MTKPLEIGLDVVPMSYPPSGVRAYVAALIEAFRSGDSGIELTPLAPLSGLTRKGARRSRLVWDLHGVSDSARKSGVDLVHMTRFAAPRKLDRPLVVTVHDLIPLQLPEYRASLPSKIQSELAKRTVVRADRIIVPSRYVASQVQSVLGVDPIRIDVIPMGVEIPTPSTAPPPITGPYVIHTGGFDVRKNLPTLIEAFALAVHELGADWRLVLVGAPHTGNAAVYPPIWPIVERFDLTDRVILTGRVSENEKDALYQHATVAVAPSRSEGFGLPILEAMAHGVPVIASNCTSHPEVAGDAAVLVEPEVETLRDALASVGTDEQLRTTLSIRGRDRAAEFPWSRTVELTRATYRKSLPS